MTIAMASGGASTLTKRKAIDDFFLPKTKRVALQENVTVQLLSDVKDAPLPSKQVSGLELHHHFVNADEERDILAFLNDPSRCTWRTDLSRRTMHFGGTYCLMPAKLSSDTTPKKPEILQAPSMPPELMWLIDRMVVIGVFDADKRPQYCIVNEYIGKNGISAHTENFQFGEPVVGLSLLSSCPIRFIELKKPFDGSVRSGKAAKAEKTGKVVDISLPGRSLLVMKGESRWKWQHEILRSVKGRGAGWKRVSLTFRWKDDRTYKDTRAR